MPVVTYSNQSSSTSGTSANKTKGDKYAKEQLGLLYAAGGLNLTAAKNKVKTDQLTAELQAKVAAGQMTQEQMAAKLAQQTAKTGKKGQQEQVYQQALSDMTPIQYYPDQTYVPLDPYTQQSIEKRAQQAQANTLGTAASGYVTDTLAGKYMGEKNPYLRGMYEDAASGVTGSYLSSVLPQLEARFAKAGGRGGAYTASLDRANSGLADELSGLAANLYGTSYMQERDLMGKAAGLAPSAQQMQFYATDELERAGREKEAQEKLALQEQMERFYFDQDKSFTALDRILNRGTQVPMAAGSGTTDWTQRTVGTGSQQAPSPPGQMPMWAQFLGSIL